MNTREMVLMLINKEMDYITKAAENTSLGFLDWLREMAIRDVCKYLPEVYQAEHDDLPSSPATAVAHTSADPFSDDFEDVESESAAEPAPDVTVPVPEVSSSLADAMEEAICERAEAEAEASLPPPSTVAAETVTAEAPARRKYTRKPKPETAAPLAENHYAQKARQYIRHQIAIKDGIDPGCVAEIMGVDRPEAARFIIAEQDAILLEQRKRPPGRPPKVSAAIHQDPDE